MQSLPVGFGHFVVQFTYESTLQFSLQIVFAPGACLALLGHLARSRVASLDQSGDVCLGHRDALGFQVASTVMDYDAGTCQALSVRARCTQGGWQRSDTL